MSRATDIFCWNSHRWVQQATAVSPMASTQATKRYARLKRSHAILMAALSMPSKNLSAESSQKTRTSGTLAVCNVALQAKFAAMQRL